VRILLRKHLFILQVQPPSGPSFRRTHTDLQSALKLEPNNEVVKTELARVDELILRGKKANKLVRPFRLLLLFSSPSPFSPSLIRVNVVQRSVPVQISTPPPAASTAPPKRRRIPITIVDDDTPQSQSPSSTSTNTPRPTDGDLLNPISSRTLSPPASTPPDAESTPATPVPTPAPAPAPTTQKPTLPPPSFKEAKQAREVKSVGRVGGGIFRMSGNDTVFKSREVPAPASPVPPAPSPVLAASTPTATPRTLFEFTRSWDRIPAADTAARWALLNVRTRHLLLARSALLCSPSQHADPFSFASLAYRRSLPRPSRHSSAPRSNPPSSLRSSPCLPPPPPLRHRSNMKPQYRVIPSGALCAR
jgi:hypothetical protein